MNSEKLRERLDMVLPFMERKPLPFERSLTGDYPTLESVDHGDYSTMLNMLLNSNPNDSLHRAFAGMLRKWDNEKGADWTEGTLPNSPARRAKIYSLFELSETESNRIDEVIPHYLLEESVVVAKKHTPWYDPGVSKRNFYWNAYSSYLHENRWWPEVSVLNLDSATRDVVERLANPESEEAYKGRGLVIGYVQSGKTANFTGVIAKAADAGYRLFIVLAGTWNILRDQTQRRLDKELIGREMLHGDPGYSPIPQDWEDFISYGELPSRLGEFDWERLTGVTGDFSDLGAAIGALDFHPVNPALRLNDPGNLHRLPARLVVIKKNASRLNKLVENLKAIRSNLANVPTLIIDDESDQAGLNTVRPGNADKNRTATNLAIVGLLNLFPRGQYVGYTATPYANALVNPNDPEDLFPRDFIISLNRPAGYMGISDFFDSEIDSDDIDSNDFSFKESAFVRDGGDDAVDSLKDAVCAFILSGAVKLFREDRDPDNYTFPHHTMLVHTGVTKAQHELDRGMLKDILRSCAFSSSNGLKLLRTLWERDYKPVCSAQAPEDPTPGDFKELRPFIGLCLDRLNDGLRIRVLNSSSDDDPDFNVQNVWCIFVGGNKLSRGYTVEGLTISYFTRPTAQADTLMQMGRWFGFRKGYKDLVRIFVGRSEGRRNVDIVDSFKQACLMEERFREDVRRYSKYVDEPLRPIDIPPLIEVTGDLRPTAANKMWNAELTKKNFGNTIVMPTLAPQDKPGIDKNLELATRLWESLGNSSTVDSRLGSDEKSFLSRYGTTSLGEVISFLKGYRWLDGVTTAEMRLLIEFLEEEDHEIEDFAVIAPQRQSSFGTVWIENLTVKNRKRLENREKKKRGFKQFGEPRHREVSRYIAGQNVNFGQKTVSPNELTRKVTKKGRAVLLLYPVREQESDLISIGFELVLPPNSLPYGVRYTTRVEGDVAVVEAT